MYAGHESEVLLSSSCGFGSGARSSLYFFLHFRDMQRRTTVFKIQLFSLTSWQLLTFICQRTGYLNFSNLHISIDLLSRNRHDNPLTLLDVCCYDETLLSY